MKESYEEIEKIKPGYKIENGRGPLTVAYVYNKTPQYVIYEILETGQITYKTAPDFPDDTYSIALKLDKVESYLDHDPVLWAKYRNTMADVYFLCLEKDKDTKLAEKLLDSIIPELELEIFGASKIMYLKPCVIVVIAMAVAAITLHSCNYFILQHHYFGFQGMDPQFLFVFYIIVFGSIGGLFSIAINIDKHQEKISSRVQGGMHRYAGLFRILISMLSAVILYVLLQSKFIVIGIKDPDKDYSTYMYYAFAILAGFSQNFVPNLIRKAEDDSTKQKPAKNASPSTTN